MKVELHPEANEELLDATHYYHRRGGTLRIRFESEIDSTLTKISRAPRRWRILEDDVRRCLCEQFPYAVLYTIESQSVLIVAFMHLSRDPGYWRDRV